LVGNAEVIVFIPGCRMETTTITNSLHRISVHMPVHYVYLVDKLLNIMISGKPGITLPITHHILQVAPFVLAFYPPNRRPFRKILAPTTSPIAPLATLRCVSTKSFW